MTAATKPICVDPDETTTNFAHDRASGATAPRFSLDHPRKVVPTTLNERSGALASVGYFRPSEPPGFLSAYPGYGSTKLLDRLRATEYSYLDAGEHIYLDYAGASLPAQAQLGAHAERIRGGCQGNPHSQSPTSAAATELIERTGSAILAYFNAPPEEYAAVFTPTATGACRLVGEANPFSPPTRLVLTYDNHNSVKGIREFARSGLVSNIDDVDRFLAFVETTYRDRLVDTCRLAPAADVRHPRPTRGPCGSADSRTPHLRWVGSRMTGPWVLRIPGRAFYPAERRSSW